MPYRPTVNSKIVINGKEYYFTEHPAAKGMPYGQSGKKATVYQVNTGQELYALKVFFKDFRTVQTEIGAQRIAAFANLPGLQVCSRKVLTRHNYPALLPKYPDLEYAVLMPWVAGQTWQEILLSRQPLTPEQSLLLARTFAKLLSVMEQNSLAHCDLSGPNVLISGLNSAEAKMDVALVDVEDLYAPGLEKPKRVPGGSAGYGHKTAATGLWSTDADRFAGAILLAEMLGWCDERVRRIAVGEQYFERSELQEVSERYQLLLNILRERFGLPADLLTQAWFSNSLDECLPLTAWAQALSMNDVRDVSPLENPPNMQIKQTDDQSTTSPKSEALTVENYQEAVKAKRRSIFQSGAAADVPDDVPKARKKFPQKLIWISVSVFFIVLLVAAGFWFVPSLISNKDLQNLSLSPETTTPGSKPTPLSWGIEPTPVPSGSDLNVEFVTYQQENYIRVTRRSGNLDYRIGPVAFGKIYIEPGGHYFVYYHNGVVYASKIDETGLVQIGEIENFLSINNQLGDQYIEIKATCETIFVSENPSVGTGYKSFSMNESYWCP